MKKPIKNSLTVFKENRLIEARYKLTLNEQKFVLFAISKINQGDSDKEYKFHIKEFINILGLESHNAYEALRRIVKLIMRHPLTFSPDSDTEIICNWFSWVKYKRKKAIISFEFAPGLIPYLFNLKKKFTVYKLRNILQLNSIYSIRLYELLKQYEWVGGNEIDLDKLKKMLGVSECYTLYADFKRNVLEVARKELLSKADISFSYKEIKNRKKVTGISFRLLKRKKKLK